MPYEYIVVEQDGPVGIITLNRPQQLNALANPLMRELVQALVGMDQDPSIRAIVITGGPQVFAAGADLKELSQSSPTDLLLSDRIGMWDQVRNIKKPLIAAVSGFALGGGCELAMQCDIIIASETARFGQPEINVGLIPGAGGTQRLTRSIGKFKAMEMILTGQFINAWEAYRRGLAVKVVPVELLLEEAVALGKELAQKAPISLRLAKESILRAFETTVLEGIDLERKNFFLLFATEDSIEGMKAFLEKRRPSYTGK